MILMMNVALLGMIQISILIGQKLDIVISEKDKKAIKLSSLNL